MSCPRCARLEVFLRHIESVAAEQLAMPCDDGDDSYPLVAIATLAEAALDDACGAGTSLPELLPPRKAEAAHG